jgi:hypothetical protein
MKLFLIRIWFMLVCIGFLFFNIIGITVWIFSGKNLSDKYFDYIQRLFNKYKL